MFERIRGSYDDVLYKSTYTLLYFMEVHQLINLRWKCSCQLPL